MSRRFPVHKVRALTGLHPQDTFMGEINGEPVVADGEHFAQTLKDDDVVENFRKVT